MELESRENLVGRSVTVWKKGVRKGGVWKWVGTRGCLKRSLCRVTFGEGCVERGVRRGMFAKKVFVKRGVRRGVSQEGSEKTQKRVCGEGCVERDVRRWVCGVGCAERSVRRVVYEKGCGYSVGGGVCE